MKSGISCLLALALAGSMLLSAGAATIDDLLTMETEDAGGALEEALAEKQEITFALNNQPDGIDPNVTNNSFATPFIMNCFEGLVTYDENGGVVPGEAESWDVSDDLTTYTFHLREGLKWSDGSSHTAQDYVYSALRVLTPDTTAQYMNMIGDYVVGAMEYFNGEASAREVGIKALDDNTLEFRLKDACPFFVDLVSMWCYFPVQEATIEANGDKWTTSADSYVSNGPFRVTEINSSERVVLEKNEHYWNADAVTLDKITFRYILDTSTALTAYESGEIDGDRTIPSSDLARLKAENAGVQVAESYGTVYYDINCAKEPYNDPNVRKALCLAIDREALINNVAQLDATPAYSFLAPGYVLDGKDITEDRGTYGLSPTADAEGAQKALAEAGYPDGKGFPTLQLSYYSDDNVKKIAEAIAEMLEKNLNIKVKVSSADWAVFYDAVQNGDYDLAAMGWSADYLNPMSFLPLFYTNDVSNNVFYSNRDYDTTVDLIRVQKDPAAFADLVIDADMIASGEYPVIPLYYKSNTYLLKDYVKGVFMTASSNLYFKNAKVLEH